MKKYGYDYDPDMDDEGMYEEERRYGKRKRPMLENVIGLLQALVNILDIIGENIGRKM
jgi:hypothetical protein